MTLTSYCIRIRLPGEGVLMDDDEEVLWNYKRQLKQQADARKPLADACLTNMRAVKGTNIFIFITAVWCAVRLMISMALVVCANHHSV